MDSIKVSYARLNKIKAMAEQRGMFKRTTYYARNIATLSPDQLKEHFNHVLIDYRDGNKRIVSKMMTRYEAATYNSRMKNSGMAWSLVSENGQNRSV